VPIASHEIFVIKVCPNLEKRVFTYQKFVFKYFLINDFLEKV